jgi:hypothetical protein
MHARSISLIALAALSACAATRPAVSEPDAVVHGNYVEARTASVYAGPCHFNGEYTTQGRTALVAFEIEGGAVDGVDLSGLSLAAVITADRNLAEPDAVRRSVVYVDRTSAPVLAAARDWLVRTHGPALGAIEDVRATDVEVDVRGEHFTVTVGEVAELRGYAMPDRACCSMPSDVWYEPLVPTGPRLAAYTELFGYRDRSLGPRFERAGENSAFLATF